ncbi:MAG: YkgJ family cysteine cluster protein [Candidatus Bathyarchaeia archaeon]
MIDSPFGRLLPWKKVRDWFCSACGECCKHFEVQLSPYELARISSFGAASRIRFEHGRIYLSKRQDGRCAFQEWAMGLWICSLADRKPTLCKLWPFHVFNRPSYGRGEQAEYGYEGRRLYIYVNSHCPNVTLGRPTERLTTLVLPEVLDIALGKSSSQRYSTSWLLDLAISWMAVEARGILGPSPTLLKSPMRLGRCGALGDLTEPIPTRSASSGPPSRPPLSI